MNEKKTDNGSDLEQAPPSCVHAMRNTEHRGSDARMRPGGEIGVSREKAVVNMRAGSVRGLYAGAKKTSTRKEYRGEVQVRGKELRANKQIIN
jgi:hypothetical protein